MDTPPVPKPRSLFPQQSDPPKHPVPLPRTKVPAGHEKVSATDILRSIGTVSKQITEDVATKVSSSAKTANEKIEKSFIGGSKFARDTLEKTLTTSRAVRDSVTKSVIEGTKNAGMRLRKSRKVDTHDVPDRCVSMSAADVGFFDNIQFHSPLLEQKRLMNENKPQSSRYMPSLALNTTQSDDASVVSTVSDSNTDSISNFSYDGSETPHSSGVNVEFENRTYDTPKASRANSVVSTLSYPEVPERRKHKELVEVMRQNSLYENWTLPFAKFHSNSIASVEDDRPSKSTICEFDPLHQSDVSPRYQGVSNELLLLESFLIGDTYGTIVSNDSHEDTFEFNDSEYFNPPTPPERFDSLFDDANSSANSNRDRNSNWFVNEKDPKPITEPDVKPANSVIQKFSRKLKWDGVLNKTTKQNTQKVDTVERPEMNTEPTPYYYGMLTKIVSGVVEDLFKNSHCQSRYCVLSDQKLMCYSDAANNILKETYTLDKVYSIQLVLPLSSSSGEGGSFGLEMSVAGPRGPRRLLFGCASAAERRTWAQRLAEHLTGRFTTHHTAEYTRCGWCYLKEGISGQWRGAWLLLVRRVLVYHCSQDPNVCSVDLRKTRCIVTQDAEEETKQVCPTDVNSNLLLDCPEVTLYLRFPQERELKGWRGMLKLAAANNGAKLHHQQLTRDDVPVIVDKCISFIYAYGSLSEGIYRRAGSGAVLGELLQRFRRDAWAVQLSPAQHSEHDVAGVLKRFFRDLPEPLLPQALHDDLIAALAEETRGRAAALRVALRRLRGTAAATARRLFGHLHFVGSAAPANRMGADNLAAVWAPTLMPAALTSNSLQTAWSTKEVYVVRELIANYEAIWQPTEAERKREAAIRKVLTAVQENRAPAARPPAGDLRVWVYVHDRNTCYQVALTPSKTCADVCDELSDRAKIEPHLLTVEEVVCGESLRRSVHMDEPILEVVLRWSYWDEEDRKDNYLMVKENTELQALEARKENAVPICGELRFASDSTKTFKSHIFEVHGGSLCYYKDKQGSAKVEEWSVKDMLWYSGHEPKRNPQSRWAITFIPRNKQKRCRERPWFGPTLAGGVCAERLRWAAALAFAHHRALLPAPRLLIP